MKSITKMVAGLFIALLLASLTAFAQGGFMWSGTWNDNNPPEIWRINDPRLGGVDDNGTRLITISGTPSGELMVPPNVTLTIRETVTGFNNTMRIYAGALSNIIWEADLTGVHNSAATVGTVVVYITSFAQPPSFEVTGSIVNTGRTVALFSDNVPVTVSDYGKVQNTKAKGTGDDNFYDCATIFSAGPVTVKDNAQVTATGGGSAIVLYETPSMSTLTSELTVNGGLVFGGGSAITGGVATNSVIQLGSGTNLNTPPAQARLSAGTGRRGIPHTKPTTTAIL